VQALPGVVRAKVSVFIPVRSLKSVERDGRPYIFDAKVMKSLYDKLGVQANKTDHLDVRAR